MEAAASDAPPSDDPGAAPRSPGKAASPAPAPSALHWPELDLNTEPLQGARWAAAPRDRLRALIVTQISAFARRPYLADEAGAVASLAAGLEHSLADDFCWSLCFLPAFVLRLCREGFLPICSEIAGGSGLYVLLPKLHAQRCVLDLDALRVQRSTRRRARAYTLTLNHAFRAVAEGCVEQHGENWLYPPMRGALWALFEARGERRGGPWPLTVAASVELWDAEGNLVAGELGCINGACYTSFTGFHRVPNTGVLQLAATGRLLQAAGMALWDLGQDFPYKRQLGARLVPRVEFLERLRGARDTRTELHARLAEGEPGLGPLNALEVIMGRLDGGPGPGAGDSGPASPMAGPEPAGARARGGSDAGHGPSSPGGACKRPHDTDAPRPPGASPGGRDMGPGAQEAPAEDGPGPSL